MFKGRGGRGLARSGRGGGGLWVVEFAAVLPGVLGGTGGRGLVGGPEGGGGQWALWLPSIRYGCSSAMAWSGIVAGLAERGCPPPCRWDFAPSRPWLVAALGGTTFCSLDLPLFTRASSPWGFRGRRSSGSRSKPVVPRAELRSYVMFAFRVRCLLSLSCEI